MDKSLRVNIVPIAGAAILTKRICHSPVYKNIWRFRTQKENTTYLVLVGEVAVHLKEVLNNGRLRDVAIKEDFECKIRSSYVFSEHTLHLNEDDTSQYEHGLCTSEFRILVLCMENGCALLVTALEDAGIVTFATHSIPLPLSSTQLSDPGRLTTADPLSRALAFAAFEDAIVLCNQKYHPRLSRLSGIPSFDTLVVNVEAVICAICFLHPPEGDKNSIDLAVIGTRVGRLCAIVCSWTHLSAPLTKDKVQIHSRRLGKEHGVVTVLAPLKQPGGFLLLCERVISIYQYGHDGSIQQLSCLPLRYDDLSDPGPHPPVYEVTSRHPPLWTTWDRSLRDYEGVSDMLYIIREDGWLHYLAFAKVQTNVSIVGAGVIGYLGANVNSSFAVMEAVKSGNERIAICGEISDGGLFEISSFDPCAQNHYPLSASQQVDVKLRQTERIQNWVPGTQLACYEQSRSQTPRHLAFRDSNQFTSSYRLRDKLFATSLNPSQGAVSELRRGVKMFVSPEPLWSCMQGMDSVICLLKNDTCTLFGCSFPWQTALMFGRNGTSTNFEIGTERSLTISTITLCSFDHKISSTKAIIYVTTFAVKVLEIDLDSSSDLSFSHVATFNFDKITAASFCAERNYLVLGIRVVDSHVICIKRLMYQDETYMLLDIGEPLNIDSEPTSVMDFSFEQHPENRNTLQSDFTNVTKKIFSCVVGTSAGTIKIIQLDNEQHLHMSWQSVTSSSDPYNTCESISLLSSLPVPTLLCGFRDGSLQVIKIHGDSRSQSSMTVDKSSFQIGILPVKIMCQSNKGQAAYIRCDSNLYYIDFQYLPFSQPRIQQIFFEDCESFQSLELSLDAVCLLDEDCANERVLCISEGIPYVGSLASNKTQLLPRHFPMPGKPKLVKYSNYLHAIISVTTITTVNWLSKKRCQTSSLNVLLSSDKTETCNDGVGEEHSAVVCGMECEPGEKINDVAEWLYTRESHKYHFLIVTTTKRHANSDDTGGLKYLKVSRSRNEPWDISIAHESREAAPVYAIAQFGLDSLVYASGLDLRIRKFDADKGRFNKPASHRLGSPAIYITATEPLINVITAEHGFQIFKLVDQHFSLVLSEDRARSGICHLQLGGKQSFLVSDRSGNVVNITQPQEYMGVNSVSAWLRARLPCSITSFIKADARPPWLPKNLGVSEDGILGIATDGSMFFFSILTEPAWILLDILQRLCRHDDRICPNRTHIPETTYRRKSLTKNYHIDGEVLARLLHLPNAAMVLEDMLRKQNYSSAQAGLAQPSNIIVPEQYLSVCRLQLEKLTQSSADMVQFEGHGEQINDVTEASKVVRDILIFLDTILEVPF